MALIRIPYPSPNFSERGGAVPRLLVCHTTQGASTIESLGNWFANPANEVSSHAGADDKVNTIGVFVRRADKAWTQANFNPEAVSIEACAWAEWDSTEWHNHPNLLANIASWLREEGEAFGIPLVRLSAAEAQHNGRGVCEHKDLGPGGGNHSDCGDHFPLDEVIAMAGGTSSAQPPLLEEIDMRAPPLTFTMDDVQQAFYVDREGRLIHCYQRPGAVWVKETLTDGWDPDTGLAHDTSRGTDQVWGVRFDGARAQSYWSGTRWVLQVLP